MARVACNGVEIEYERFGAASAPAVLLIMGLGAQLLYWDQDFCQQLADFGYQVVRYDNRDCGLSTHFDGLAADPAPYLLTDMAADAVGLLDHLGVDKAHIVGSSMGGMIAQTLAIRHPDRVRSLASMMSNTGEPDRGALDMSLATSLSSKPSTEREAYIRYRLEFLRLLAGSHWDEEWARDRELRCYDRAFYPEGAVRHTAAIAASGSRAAELAHLQVPALVVHGRLDPIIPVDGGLRTAELIDGCEILIIEDMGHGMPPPVWASVIEAIHKNASRAA